MAELTKVSVHWDRYNGIIIPTTSTPLLYLEENPPPPHTHTVSVQVETIPPIELGFKISIGSVITHTQSTYSIQVLIPCVNFRHDTSA